MAERVRDSLEKTVRKYNTNDRHWQLTEALDAYFNSWQLGDIVELDCINEDLLALHDLLLYRSSHEHISDYAAYLFNEAPDIIARFSKLTEPIKYALFYPSYVSGCIDALILLAKCPVDFRDLEPIRQAAIQAVSVFHTHISHAGKSKEMKEFADAEYRKYSDPLDDYYASAGLDSEELWRIHDDLGDIYESIVNKSAVKIEKAIDAIDLPFSDC